MMIGDAVRIHDPGHPYHGRRGVLMEEASHECWRVRLDDSNPDFVAGVYTFGRANILPVSGRGVAPGPKV